MKIQSRLKYLPSLLLRCHLMLVCGSSWKHMTRRFILYSRNVQIHLRWGRQRHLLSPAPSLIVRSINWLSVAVPSLIHGCVCLAKLPITSSFLSIPSRMRVSKAVGMIEEESETEMLAASPPHSIVTDLRCVPEGQRIKQSYRARMQPACLCCFQGGLLRPDSESRLYENSEYVND